MGEEISTTEFDREDFVRFERRLEIETAALRQLFDGGLSETGYSWGLELEACLIDHSFFPTPINEAFLAALGDDEVVPELSRFNVELNTPPQQFGATSFTDALRRLERLWAACQAAARPLDGRLVAIGILPCLREKDLSLANISPLKRYYALNHELMRTNRGVPFDLDIHGREHLRTRHADVMLEAAATSFQVHFKTPASEAHRYFNAAQALSAAMVAATANSPLLFEHLLWCETRIPLFEQAIAGVTGPAAGHPRVFFDADYLVDSVQGCFRENRANHRVLLPIVFDEPDRALRHLRLHNGTIWRWNRPLVDTDASIPHVRLEHRVLPAGPSLVDMIANAALFLGAVHEFVMRDAPLPDAALARADFYLAARNGLAAQVHTGGTRMAVRDYVLGSLLDLADAGLARLGVVAEERRLYLGIVHARIESERTGAAWQTAWFEALDCNPYDLTARYCMHQDSGWPVHEWDWP